MHNKNRTFNVLFPSINVHCWGGFGSQIFASFILDRISLLFPSRRIKIIFHGSGVTQRYWELPTSFTNNYEVVKVNDYVETQENLIESSAQFEGFSVRGMMTMFLEYLGFLSRLNKEGDFSRLKPWVVSIRGHYTGIRLRNKEIELLCKRLGISEKLEFPADKTVCSLHFRLGDLMTLRSKSYIQVERLKDVLNKFAEVDQVNIFSDSSPEEALQIIGEISLDVKPCYFHVSPIEVIMNSLASDIFIGTNSKLSLWIALLRAYLLPDRKTYIPDEIFVQFAMLVPENTDLSNFRRF